jgi:hypothetical protein
MKDVSLASTVACRDLQLYVLHRGVSILVEARETSGEVEHA